MKRLAIIFVVLAVSACGNLLSATRHAGGHSFAVPRSQLLEVDIWFLPKAEDGFSFILNPTDELSHQMSVAVTSAQQMCNNGLTPDRNPSAPFCGKMNLVSPSGTPFPLAKLHKKWGNMGDAAWGYTMHYPDGDHRVVSCTKLSPTKAYPGDKRGGLCYALGGYRDLVFMIYFRESKLPQVPILVGEVQKNLSKWEAAAKN